MAGEVEVGVGEPSQLTSNLTLTFASLFALTLSKSVKATLSVIPTPFPSIGCFC